jgi:electron transfer flavoprotein beta subunit
MRIVVLVKHVPDTAYDRSFADDLTVNRVAADGRLSELDEHAVEQALQLVEQVGEGEITYLTMGPAGAGDAVRKALSMGGDAGIHVVDDALHGSDAMATSLVLAAALRRLEWDLVVCGMSSTDASMGVVPAMLSERLGVPGLTLARELAVDGSTVTIRRDVDDASVTVTASLPALVSVTDQTGEARYPTFKGILASKRKPVTTWSLADIGIDPGQVGFAGSWSAVESISRRPPRVAGVVITDEGDGGVGRAAFHASRALI